LRVSDFEEEFILLKKFLSAMIFCLSVAVSCSAAEFELVSYSAHVKLQWLAMTGDPDAQQILKQLGKTNIYGRQNLHDFERVEKVNGIYQEICYATTVEYVQKNNYKNIFDIGGGYSPRAMVFAKEGRKYYSGELAAVAVSANDVMSKILEPQYMKNITYDEVLAEDHDAFMEVAKTMDGKICIVEQGLMIYLNQDRLADMYENIRDVLKRNGGCFITSDMSTRELFKDITEMLYGKDQVELIYSETKDMYEELFDSLINEENFDNQLDAVGYAEEDLNLHIKKVPLLSDVSKLHSTKNLSAAQVEQLKKICAKNYLWVMTVD